MVEIKCSTMALSMAALLRAPCQTGRFVFVLYVIWMFLILDVVCLIVNNRQTLLEIGSTVTANRTLNSSTPTRCLQTTLRSPLFGPPDRNTRKRNRRRGKRASVPTKHATYQIVLPIIYLDCFKGKFRLRVGVNG